MKEEFIIPIDDKIKEFKNHLESHPRTIFSAKFGDGKSYFLTKFKDNEDVCNEYKILTIHPVNYQVLENKDIFELIKRDILAQILVNGMISKSYDLSNSEALYYYLLQGNTLNLMEDMLKIITPLGLEAPIITPLLACVKSLNLFKKTRKKIEKIKQDANIIDKADEYIKLINNSKYIYEEDVYTKLIKDAINDYKANNEGKKVALIVEDMDRLDPAHLFRIMNVFSAHVDYCNKYGIENKELPCDNKYGFDNIVFVMDYDNTEKIFYHFYGKDTDYSGYICKFASKGYFEYSLKRLQYQYINEMISMATGIKQDLLVKIMIDSHNLTSKNTIRKLVEACENIDSQIYEMPTIKFNEINYNIHPGILRLFIIMKRLGYSNDDIIKPILDATCNTDVKKNLMMYLVGLIYFNENIATYIPLYIDDSHTYSTGFKIVNITAEGIVNCEEQSCGYFVNNRKPKYIKDFIMTLFNLIGK